jgi:diketogulonate reductase-like aldo/keto reductase
MQQRIFGATGRKVAVVGQGTWNIESAPRAGVVTALRRGLDLGMTHIDSAEMYGSGEAEEIVGEAIAGRRDEVFLVSKVLPGNASKKGTVSACEKSLKRMGTDRLDSYLLHWRGRYPLEETIGAFEQLKQEGKILSWGVSNFDVADLEEAEKIAGPGKMACNQVLYHLEERAIEHAVLPWCSLHKVPLVAYSPFGSGDFPSPASPGGKVLAKIAGAHNASPRQVALAFLLRFAAVFTIPKAANPVHVADNAGGGDLQLSDIDVAAIAAAFPLGAKPRGLPML